MNLSTYFQHKTLPSLGLLALRLVVGSAFILHGWGKIQTPFTWMGDAIPGFMQALAAFSEFGGGIALILGLLTPLSALGLMGTMVGAMTMVHLPAGDPFVAKGPGQGSYELALVYLVSALAILLNSPGRFSVDYLLFGKSQLAGEQTHGVKATA